MDKLPKGLRIDHGSVQVRIQHKGVTYCKNFGPVCAKALEFGTIHLSKKREEIILEKFGYGPNLDSRLFKVVANIFFDLWSKELSPEGTPKHTERSIKNLRSFLDSSLIPYFGKMQFEGIKPIHVQEWRDSRTQVVLGTSVNREQAVLSSVFNHIEDWVKIERIKPFKIPAENPTKHIEFAKTRKRERVLTDYEISKMKWAFRELGDDNGCQNFELKLMTCMSHKDVIKLHFGEIVNLNRSKSGVPITIPITVDYVPNWTNWRKRFVAAQEKADILDFEDRDLRKTGGNLLVGDFDIKLISQYMAHSNVRTTEQTYTLTQMDKMRPLAEAIRNKVKSL